MVIFRHRMNSTRLCSLSGDRRTFNSIPGRFICLFQVALWNSGTRLGCRKEFLLKQIEDIVHPPAMGHFHLDRNGIPTQERSSTEAEVAAFVNADPAE
jgi:hypothetical protein